MRKTFEILVVAILFFVFGSAAHGTLTKPNWDCSGALRGELNSSLRLSGGEVTRRIHFEVPEPGILVLDIVGYGEGDREPVISFSQDCDRRHSQTRPFQSLMRSPAHWMLVVQDPGPLAFKILPDLEGEWMNDYRLRVDFVPMKPLSKEDEEILEIEPETLRGSSPSRLPELCRGGKLDDHADIFPCATRLEPGEKIGGNLFSAQGDDVDVFAFELDPSHELWTVVLDAVGDSETHGSLFDQEGRRLDRSSAQSGEPLQIVRTLPPGRYFVRVEGWNFSHGQYELGFEATFRG